MTDVGIVDRFDSPSSDDGDRRLVITLTGDAAAVTRRLANELGVNPPEAVRRGLTLLDVLVGLSDSEELVVRDRKTHEVDRLRFHWGYR